MAEQDHGGASAPVRHTEAGEHAAHAREPEAREPEARSGPRPDERSDIQWWEACGGWSVRYAMGTF